MFEESSKAANAIKLFLCTKDDCKIESLRCSFAESTAFTGIYLYARQAMFSREQREKIDKAGWPRSIDR